MEVKYYESLPFLVGPGLRECLKQGYREKMLLDLVLRASLE